MQQAGFGLPLDLERATGPKYVALRKKQRYRRNCYCNKYYIFIAILLVGGFVGNWFFYEIYMAHSQLKAFKPHFIPKSAIIANCLPHSKNGKCGPMYGNTVCTSETNRYCSKYGWCGSQYSFWKDKANMKYWRESIPESCYETGETINMYARVNCSICLCANAHCFHSPALAL